MVGRKAGYVSDADRLAECNRQHEEEPRDAVTIRDTSFSGSSLLLGSSEALQVADSMEEEIL